MVFPVRGELRVSVSWSGRWHSPRSGARSWLITFRCSRRCGGYLSRDGEQVEAAAAEATFSSSILVEGVVLQQSAAHRECKPRQTAVAVRNEVLVFIVFLCNDDGA